MSKDHKPGYYKDAFGNWQKDRRKRPDRRSSNDAWHQDERRRNNGRRKTDLEVLEKDHKRMIEEALEDFAEEHGGHT